MYEIPIFPLNTVLFPGMPLRLFIFEERYKHMMARVLETNRTFGVCLIKSGAEAHGPLAEPFLTGCTARVVQVEPLQDGQMNMTAVGDERFRILKAGNANPYLKAFVETQPLASHHSLPVMRGAAGLRAHVHRYLKLLTRVSATPDEENHPSLNLDLARLELPEDPLMLIYLAAALLQIPSIEKQPLLESETAAGLLEHLQRLYRRELAVFPHIHHYNEDDIRHAGWAN